MPPLLDMEMEEGAGCQGSKWPLQFEERILPLEPSRNTVLLQLCPQSRETHEKLIVFRTLL